MKPLKLTMSAFCLRTNVLTASAGEAIMAHRFKEYQ